jgi:hypothetical protein
MPAYAGMQCAASLGKRICWAPLADVGTVLDAVQLNQGAWQIDFLSSHLPLAASETL